MPDGEVIVQMPGVVLRSGFQWLVDESASTDTAWKLAIGAKKTFEGYKCKPYDEATEGFVMKKWCGHETLVSTCFKNVCYCIIYH